jgi:rhamnogalacturonyl hydrolase YesR
MKKIFLLVTMLILAAASTLAQKRMAKQVLALADSVAVAYQRTHSDTLDSWWDNAVFHVGNIELYKVSQNPLLLDYTLSWARHNKFLGATEPDKRRWKFKEPLKFHVFVLSAEWEVCFQVYYDLAKITGDTTMTRRAREVFGFQFKTLNVNFWNWMDALFMAMPGMAKFCNENPDTAYVRRIGDYFHYFDKDMYDADDGLYFRDPKYLYPAHKSLKGKKDFWARGNGWVFAAFARVMREWKMQNCDLYRERFVKMASAIKHLQTEEGYFPNCLKDPEHSKGRESTGTSLFLYGLCCGINDGILNRDEFAPIIEKAWKFLSQVAVQPDYSVGYVYDTPERQVLSYVPSPKTTTNYGTGCFLLAASEYAKYLEKAKR